MDYALEQQIADEIIKYYPSINISQSQGSKKSDVNSLCKSALANSELQEKWYRFKQNASKRLGNYTELTFDTELINGAPCFRYGLQIHNDSFQMTTFSFYISIIMPVFSWYFIDREKYPKNRNENKLQLGPPKTIFYKFHLQEEYDKLNNYETKSILDLPLLPDKLLAFLSPHPRFDGINDEELKIIDILIDEVYSVFGYYSYIDYKTGNIEANYIIPKSLSPIKYYTYFECLFTRDLGYI